MLKLTHRAGSCENGPCPNVFDVEGDGLVDMIAIQGATMTDPSALAQLSEKPPHESLVLVPRQLILEYAEKIRKEGTVDA